METYKNIKLHGRNKIEYRYVDDFDGAIFAGIFKDLEEARDQRNKAFGFIPAEYECFCPILGGECSEGCSAECAECLDFGE